MSSTTPAIVDDLLVALGAKLIAYIAGVSDSRTVREWAEANRRPTPAVEDRLHLAHRIVTLIAQSEGEAVVATWFQGMNPQLGDRSPARVLHEDSFDDAGARVLAAANAFIGGSRSTSSSRNRKIPEVDEHQRAVESLARAMAALPTVVDPATARAVQATENVWRRVEAEFGLLSSSEVSSLLGASNGNRAYALALRKRGALSATRRKNRCGFPGFQFDHESGTVLPWVAPLLELAERYERPAAGVILWMMSPTTYFADEDRPVDHVDDAEGLLSVAERDWGVEW